jgi:hypothetical protein
MLTGWLLSLIASFSMDIEALEADDPKVRELATVDLLLNLGQILLEGTPPTSALGAARRDIPALPLPARVAEQWPAPAGTRIREGWCTCPACCPSPTRPCWISAMPRHVTASRPNSRRVWRASRCNVGHLARRD